MAVLLIAELNNDQLAEDATGKALAAAKMMGDVTILCVGEKTSEAAKSAAKLNGAKKVLFVESKALGHELAEAVSDLIVSLSVDFTHIVAPSTAGAKNILPRLAASLDTMIISDVTAIVDADTFERPIYAGNAIQTVKSQDKIKIITIRTATFEMVSQDASTEVKQISYTSDQTLSEWIEDMVATTDRPELTSAGNVVSGGRGVGSKEDFVLIEKLADKLGAAVGASRAAVDSGYAPNDWQVGQTGKVVAPDLYVAVGISGAIQHLAGMKDSKIIVAINKDDEAPIFQVADYGLVGDLFEVLPELIEKI
ncbi:MAG: electron transfer flavoprotein subunit alpha/FixB family protein [Paracoccaceae bacterium]